MSYVGSELRELRREVVRLNRKLALSRMPGKVVERDASKRMVKVELGRDPETDKPVKSPWLRVQSSSAGAFKSFVLPSVGEQVYVMNASGVVGADSVVTFGTFTGDTPHPSQEADEAVIAENGQTRLAIKNGQLHIKVGGAEMKMTAEGPAFTGGKIKHDGKSIGSDHRHGEVKSGADKTGPPGE